MYVGEGAPDFAHNMPPVKEMVGHLKIPTVNEQIHVVQITAYLLHVVALGR